MKISKSQEKYERTVRTMNDLGKLRRITLWFVLTISVPNFCACNTVAGLGKDMEKLGDKIEKKAEQKKRY
jgi:entericidin A